MSVKIHVIGRLGNDAEVRQTKTNRDFSTFNLAVDDFKQNGKVTTWFTVADFSEAAKRRAEFLKKGTLIEVQGIETCRVYTDRDGLPQIARDIRATNIEFIPIGRNNGEQKDENKVNAEDVKTNTLSEQIAHAEADTNNQTVAVSPVSTAVATSVASSDIVDDLPF